MTKLGIISNIIDLVLLYYDNNEAIVQVKEVVWIKKFMTKLGLVPSIIDLVILYYDNNGAIMQAKEPRSHQRSKHVLRRYHVIREIIGQNDIKIEQIPTDDNIADPFTKVLLQQKHDSHAESLGIRYMGDWL